MKTSDINELKKELGISARSKFLGYVIFNTENEDFLTAGTGKSDYIFSFIWVRTPELAQKFSSYELASEAVKRLELGDRTLILMAFDLGANIGVIELPSFWTPVN